MSNRICTLNHLVYRTRQGDCKYDFKVNISGERTTMISEKEADEYLEDGHAAYICTNCGRSRSVDKFEELRKHLGKFNDVVDPFEIKEAPT